MHGIIIMSQCLVIRGYLEVRKVCVAGERAGDMHAVFVL